MQATFALRKKDADMKNIRISAFGDSVLKGTVLESVNPLKYTLPENCFTDICSASLGVRIDNFARFGSTLDSGERMLIRHMTGLRAYDFTLLEFGGNDCDYYWSAIAVDPQRRHLPNTPVTEFSIKYGKIVDRVRELGSSPVLLTLPPVEPVRYFSHITRDFSDEGRSNVLGWLGGTPDFIREWHEMYNFRVLEMAAVKGVPAIDITSPFYSRPGYGKLLCEDGAHPNAQGQKVMAGALENGLRKIIQERALEGLGGVKVAFC